jgi:hypothetical protein
MEPKGTTPNTTPVKPEAKAPAVSPPPKEGSDETVTLSKSELDALVNKAKSAEGRLAKLDQDKALAEEKALQEQGKWQEIAEANEAKFQALRKELFTEKASGTLAEEARKAGAVNPKAAVKLAMTVGEISQDDTGNVLNAAEMIQAAMNELPELFKAPGTRTELPDGNPHTPPGSDLQALTAQLQEEVKKPGIQQDTKKIIRLTQEINKARKAG